MDEGFSEDSCGRVNVCRGREFVWLNRWGNLGVGGWVEN